MSKVYQSVEMTEYDANSGEVTHQIANNIIRWGQEPDYIKLYLQDIFYLSDVPKQYVSTMMSLLRRMSYAGEELGMCVVLAPVIKDAICNELGIKRRSSLDNILQKLIKGKIIFRVDRGVYRLNPYLFGRGQWSDIARIRTTVDYTPENGRTFKTVIEEAEKPKLQTLSEEKQPQLFTDSPESRTHSHLRVMDKPSVA